MPHIGEENSVLSLQYPKGRHSIPIFIDYEPGRKFGQAMKTQHHDGQRQCQYDPPRDQPEAETFRIG